MSPPLYTEVETCWFTFVRSVHCHVRLSSSSIVQSQAAPANTRRWPNAGLMLAHRLRRWANISPVLSDCVVFADCGPASQTESQH